MQYRCKFVDDHGERESEEEISASTSHISPIQLLRKVSKTLVDFAVVQSKYQDMSTFEYLEL